MSLLDPPIFSSQSSSAKRKRPNIDEPSSSFPSHLPHDSINPLSHPPSLLAQLSAAGLSATDTDPAERIPDFPHRGVDRGPTARNVELDSDPETSADDETDNKPTSRKKRQDRNRNGHYGVLIQAIHQFLDQGEIEKASRAYGLVLQLRPQGHPVDIRKDNLWAMGAEILMCHGQDPAPEQEHDDTDIKMDSGHSEAMKRWGRASNMGKVKAYFDTIIQQHPYDHKHPRLVSALDFWLALLSCEVYNTHTEHVLALQRAVREANEVGYGQDAYGADDSFGSDSPEAREVRLQERKEELRLQALASLKDIATRMDGLLQDLPYSRNPHYLRLRAMAHLYMADLSLPLGPSSAPKLQGAQRARQMEQEGARNALERFVAYGGELDEATLAVLNPSDEEEDDPSMPLYSSLPIRGL